MKSNKCKRGHDVTSPESRYKNGNCKACFSSPEVKAKQMAYSRSREAKIKRAANNAKLEVKVRIKASKAAYHAHPERKVKLRQVHLEKIGWNLEMFEQTKAEQGNACAICRKPFTAENPPCADHIHSNPPAPRGLLHGNCNTAIGLLKEDPEIIRAAAAYVEAWA